MVPAGNNAFRLSAISQKQFMVISIIIIGFYWLLSVLKEGIHKKKFEFSSRALGQVKVYQHKHRYCTKEIYDIYARIVC